MGLKPVYLVASRLFAWMRLSVSDSTARDVEILMLRHQLSVVQRRDPRLTRKLTWAYRAWLALLAGLLPASRLSRIRLIVTPARCWADTGTCCGATGRDVRGEGRDVRRHTGTSRPGVTAGQRQFRVGLPAGAP